MYSDPMYHSRNSVVQDVFINGNPLPVAALITNFSNARLDTSPLEEYYQVYAPSRQEDAKYYFKDGEDVGMVFLRFDRHRDLIKYLKKEYRGYETRV